MLLLNFLKITIRQTEVANITRILAPQCVSLMFIIPSFFSQCLFFLSTLAPKLFHIQKTQHLTAHTHTHTSAAHTFPNNRRPSYEGQQLPDCLRRLEMSVLPRNTNRFRANKRVDRYDYSLTDPMSRAALRGARLVPLQGNPSLPLQ